MTIRTAVPDDAAPIVAVAGRIDLTAFATPRSFRSMLERETPESTEHLVVDMDDSIVAWAPSGAVLLEDGEPIALSLVVSNRDQARAGAQLTTVRRDRRGRGLAHAVKAASLHRARSLGLGTMLTANDLENQAMLAANRKLGFEPSILLEDYEKVL